jgi:hypothetical protein
MSTLAQQLELQYIADMWRAACAECIFDLARGDTLRRFMFLW